MIEETQTSPGTSTSTTWRSTHHPLLKETKMILQDGERLAPQRAPVAGRQLSSKPPTTAGHGTREGLKRPLQPGFAGLPCC